MTLGEQNRQLFAKLALIAAGMFGFGYALVPFYYQICAAWGVNSLGEVRDAGHAGERRGRPEAAGGCDQHRAVVHVLRGRGARGEKLMERLMERASFLDTVKTVLSGFLGVRKRADHERAQLNPVHLIIV